MRILHINKFAYRKGGAEVYMLSLAERQAEQGHGVAVFGHLPDGISWGSENVQLFNAKVTDFHNAPVKTQARVAAEVIWNSRIRRELAGVLTEFCPDIVHLHNYSHQLTSSIVHEIFQQRVSLIHTAHDYKLICPSYLASVKHEDCFKCALGPSTKLIRQRCHHGSIAWSTVVGAETLLVRHRQLVPRTIIAPSKFMADRLKNSWLAPIATIHLIRNPLPDADSDWVGDGGYLLYVGRLSREKGVLELAAACEQLSVPLVLAGDGPERESLSMYDGRWVTLLGHVDSQDRLRQLRRGCIAQVVPSVWPENAPLSVLEAVAQGVPVIASDRGGLPELEALGLPVVYLKSLDSIDLREALSRIDQGGTISAPELHGDLGWAAHLAAVEATYVSEAKGGQ